jgi:PAS domain S-box-containing protein
MKISIEYKLGGGLIIAFLLVLFFAMITGEYMNSVIELNKKQNDFEQTSKAIHETRNEISNIVSSARGFALTGNILFESEFKEDLKKETLDWATLSSLLKNDSYFINKKVSIDNLIKQRISFADSVIIFQKKFGINKTAEFISNRRGDRLSIKINRELGVLLKYNGLLSDFYEKRETDAANRTITLFSILALLIFVILSIVFIFFKKDLTWRRKSRNEFKLLSESLEIKVEERILELKASELKFRFLAENTSDVISLHDLNAIYTYISDSVTNITGFLPSEMIGRSAYDFVHSDDVEFIKTRTSNIANRTSVKFSQFRHKIKNGGYIWLEAGANFTFDESGAISGLIVSTRNISERKKSEEELVESKYRMTAVLENSIDSIWSIDNEFKLVAFNKNYKDITEELTASEVTIGMKVFENLEAESKMVWKGLYERALTGERFTADMTAFYRGADHIHEISFNPIVLDGKVLGTAIFAPEVTEKRLKDRLLAENRSLLNGVLENTTTVIYIKDINGRYLHINKQYEKLFNVTNAEIIGKTSYEILPKLVAEKCSSQEAQVISTKSLIEIEETIPINNLLYTYLTVLFPLFNEKNEVYAVTGILTDITKRKQIEEELIESKSKLAAILENSTDSIWSLDCELRLIGYNKLYQIITKQFTGIDVQIGMKILEYCEPEVRAVWIGLYERAIAGERFMEELTEFYDGIYHTHEISFNPIVINNKVVGVAIFAHDITSKKLNDLQLIESNARTKAVLENSSDSIWSIDKNLKLISFNNSYFESTKLFFEVEPYIGMPILDSLDSEKQKLWSKLYERALSGEHFSEETDDITIGLELYFDVSFNPIVVNNEITGVAIFARDISSRKNTERQLESKVKELNTFMYKATHDLRSPLVSVMGLVQLAKDLSMDNELVKYFDMIDLSVHKMDNLLVDLVKIVNVSQGKLLLESVNFNDIIDDILLSLSSYPDFSEFIFRRQIHSDIAFKSDKRLLHSVLQNLIDNAIKYKRVPSSTEPMIIITINVNEKQAQIGITDNGMGMPGKIQDRVFEMFYRGTTSSHGTGLGLYIVKTSVEKMGGKIMLSSIEGKGTSINIIIPNASE